PLLGVEQEPKLTGAVVRSDRWTVRRAAGEEEFEGNVTYDQLGEHLESDWALHKKPENRWMMRGRVRAEKKFENGDIMNLTGETGQFWVLQQKGQMSGNPVRFELNSTSGTYKATALESRYDHTQSRLELLGNTSKSQERPIAWQKGDSWIGTVEAEKIIFFRTPDRMIAEGKVKGWIHETPRGKNP
ncbi:MAG: hypothetical protein HY399_02875, partial [Elusimicrobia bacterium]|nr:hypothetical protein [Elusimicrobiota bacterium]